MPRNKITKNNNNEFIYVICYCNTKKYVINSYFFNLSNLCCNLFAYIFIQIAHTNKTLGISEKRNDNYEIIFL